MKNIIFLPKEIILFFHNQLIKTYGGTYGIRDKKLLDSALKLPKTTFEDKYLHDTLIKMAAAYGFHLCNNHPFVDGNKRIALVAMDVFLQRNGIEITASEKETYKIMIKLAAEKLNKNQLVKWLEHNTSPLTD
ncbi:MAG: type II toxin-antitoxin system death-on-curing family toxin [Halanaerobiales bacterium]